MDLYDCCLNGDLDTLRHLLSTNLTLDINQKICGETPLQLASGQNHPEIVSELLNHQADLNITDNRGQTPLHSSAKCNSICTVKELIHRGAHLNLQDDDGNTPLHSASYNGHIAIIQELIAHGANVNLQNKDGDTPLYIAVHYRYFDLVHILLPLSDLTLQNKYTQTASKQATTKEIRNLINDDEMIPEVKNPDQNYLLI